MLFEGFTLSMIELGEVTLRVRHGGSGPPLLLLHGHPQTHMMWHAIAPQLARHFTVIAPICAGMGIAASLRPRLIICPIPNM
jgi:haloacetate dehalogenase